MKNIRSTLARLCLTHAVIFIVACGAKAISVQVLVGWGAYCGMYQGSLYVEVQGGTAPYQYDWYRFQGGTWQPYCMSCGSTIEHLYPFDTFKVVVTDATMASAEGSETVPGFIATVYYSVDHLPYLSGTSPVVRALVGPDGQILPVVHQVEATPSIASGGVLGYWSFLLPPGTTSYTLSAWATYPPDAAVCPAVDNWGTIGPPTVLPTLTPLQVRPSCSNGSTGGLDVSLTNGILPQGISLRLKNTSGTIVQSFGVTSGEMPTAVRTFTGLAPGNYQLVVSGLPSTWPMNAGMTGYTYTCRDSIPITIPSTGTPCGQVQGTVFIDANLNCTKQSNESSVPSTILKILPGPIYVNTGSTGTYSLQLLPGNYTINEESSLLVQNCSATPIPFTVPNSITPITVNVPCTSTVAMDVALSLSSGPARPGFEMRYGLALNNRTPLSSGAVTVTMQLDPVLSFVSATPAPTSVNGSTLTWSQAALAAYQGRDIIIRTMVPADVGLLGSTLTSSATVVTAVTNGNLANNTAVSSTVVVGSYDPNDKLVSASNGSTTEYDPAQNEWIDYTIRFQNTGTASAFTVVVTDTLPSTLDPGSIIVGAGSHPFTWTLTGANVLRVQFLNIQLPHSAVNEPASHGFVGFRIKPNLPLAVGTQITNRANIYFDFNPPIITDPAVLTVPVPPLLVSARVNLGGPYNSTTSLMADDLRAISKLPFREPYTALGYAHVGGGGSGTALPSAFTVTGNNAIVDWVIVELRSSANSGNILASKSALVQRDGDVVGMNGTSPVAFARPAGAYYISIKHRNHLGVMTSTTRSLSTTATTVDFTLPATSTYGANAQNTVGGTKVLWPGDGDRNGTVQYTGLNNDRDPILVAIGGSVATNTVTNIYSPLDINMNGTISYTGLGNDRDVILQTIGGVVATATRIQQLP